MQRTHANHRYAATPTPTLATMDRTSTPVTRFQQRRHHLPSLRQSPSDVIRRNHQRRAAHHPRLPDLCPTQQDQVGEAADPICNRDAYSHPLGARLRAKLREIGRPSIYPRVFACYDQVPLPSSREKYVSFTCAGGTAAELPWSVSFEQQDYRKT